MARCDFRTPRLYVLGDLAAGGEATPSEAGIHYLRNVLRLPAGAEVQAFNGRDGEWLARLATVSKREIRLESAPAQPQPQQVRCIMPRADQHARLDFVVEKAVELARAASPGYHAAHASRARNIDHAGQYDRGSRTRGVLALPETKRPFPTDWLAAVDARHTIVSAMRMRESLACVAGGSDAAFTSSAEGGFHPKEREALIARQGVVRLSRPRLACRYGGGCGACLAASRARRLALNRIRFPRIFLLQLRDVPAFPGTKMTVMR